MTVFRIKFCLLILTILVVVTNAFLELKTVIDEINSIFQFELNVLINFNSSSDLENYQNLLKTSDKPVIVYNSIKADITSIYQRQNHNLLVIVWLNEMVTVNDTIKFLDRIIWKLHWVDIMFVKEHLEEEFNLLYFFEVCRNNGYVNVLLWSQGLLYSYRPFPNGDVVRFTDVKMYADKSHLNNFQGYKILVPFRERAPHCFSYRNRKGELILAGYWFKIIDIFIKHYNGTNVILPVTLEQTKNPQDIQKLTSTFYFDFIPTAMYFSDFYSNSDIFYLSKVVIICSMPLEIPESWYLLITYDNNVWLLCLFVFFILSLLLALIYRFFTNYWQISKAFIDAFTTLTHLPSNFLNQRSPLFYILHLMPIISGFLLSNFHNSNLYSMLTAKIYEKPLESLQDITKTNKKILESVNDIDQTLSLASVPQFIKDRLITIDSIKEFFELRSNLNVTQYFYTGPEDLADFYLFQQQYLIRPFATALKQALYTRPYFFAMPHRSLFLKQFNRYLMYVHENGLYDKLQNDAKWDGFIGGKLKFFVGTDIVAPLSMEYFQIAFLLLLMGQFVSFIVFLLEKYIYKRNLRK
ncbi:ionotropic receptor 67c [Cochliomyia hominivorax]